MKSFLSIMEKRYSCRNFLRQELSDSEKTLILEAGRLTPCSFGLETTRFHICESPESRNGMFKACFGQNSVKTSPFIVVLASLEDDVDPDGEYARKCFIRNGGDLDYFIEDFRPYYEGLVEKGKTEDWKKCQAYLCAANMMTAAASAGIQSCAIEGFDPEMVKNLLFPGKKSQAEIVLVFGYPDDDFRPKLRFSTDDLVVKH